MSDLLTLQLRQITLIDVRIIPISAYAEFNDSFIIHFETKVSHVNRN